MQTVVFLILLLYVVKVVMLGIATCGLPNQLFPIWLLLFPELPLIKS